jgi:hypothetical protein
MLKYLNLTYGINTKFLFFQKMKIALCLLVALCVLSITMAKGRGKGGKHGQGKHDDKPMDGPNSDHKPTDECPKN